ncbi:MAG TPA: nickel pincer cofactor biosynthesis protein LarC [Pyrinomonadaceae bacterium]|nr:nickel pincer cofactor biosynthesis protein LarC [Pyrinomonadaceae bacterium]
MRTLYFDCFAGASGDMILGALVGVGVDPRRLCEELALLGVEGYELDFGRADRSGISATRANVRVKPENAHRHLDDILKIIHDSRLSEGVKDRSAKIFTRLAEAESRVHNVAVERIHFHEVGALDAIVDVVGACIGFDLLGIGRFVSSPLHVGSGVVEMAHGRFPVPPPAVTELLKNAPVYATADIVGELVTPTGAAIISTVVAEYGALPLMKIEGTGYGAGTREYQNFPNVLRVIVGEGAAKDADTAERLLMVETNIDDMSPQLFGYVMEKALAEGALDCYFTPVQMKKNRPGVLLQILCRPADLEAMCGLLFSETTTLGVRSYEVERRALERETVRVETPYGPIDVKVARIDGRVAKEMPEYEQCRAAAESAGVALRLVEAAALAAYHSLRRESG